MSETQQGGAAGGSGRLDPRHPIVFRQGFARFAGRLQWVMLLAGALGVPAGAVAWALGAATWNPLAVGAALFAAGIIWSQVWRRLLKRGWWGNKYGRWT